MIQFRKLIAVVISTFVLFSIADARPFARDCTPGFTEDLRDSVAYIATNLDAVRSLYEADHSYHARRGAERRVARRLDRDRKLNKIWFACANNRSPMCQKAAGRHAFGAASNKIRICEQVIRRRNSGSVGFCDLMSTVAHEFGHAVGIKKAAGRRHGRRQNDRVYDWDQEWFDFCRANMDDRALRVAGGR